MASRSKRGRLSNIEDNSMETDSDSTSEFDKRHQLILTYLMHTRMAKKVDLISVHKKLFGDEETLTDTLSTLTNKINALKMDIKQIKCDLSGETYFVMIHTAGESYFTKCSIFSKHQLEFLRQIMTGIVLSDEGAVGKIQALNSCQGLSKTEAEEAIRLFGKEKLIIEDKSGILCLSPLAVVEFAPFFDMCLSGNLKTCDLCKQLTFVGITCKGCKQRFHQHCVTNWKSNQREECPKCSQSWSGSQLEILSNNIGDASYLREAVCRR